MTKNKINTIKNVFFLLTKGLVTSYRVVMMMMMMMMMMMIKMIRLLRGKKIVIRRSCPCSSSKETEPKNVSVGCQFSVAIGKLCYKVAPTRVHYKVAGMFVPQERTA
jgi:hypothetical protein